jgi:biotin--protein ligase
LKWPNDIYAKTDEGLQKIGGILVTSEYSSDDCEFVLTIGCGLNILNQKPSTCIQNLTSNPLSLEKSLADILVEFDSLYEELDSQIIAHDCFAIFRERYYKHWLHS